MMSEGIRRRNLRADEDGDARLTAGFVTAGVLTFIILAVVLFTDVPTIGPNEGELAPNLIGKVHMPSSSSWDDFELYEEIDHGWSNETDPNAKWFLIQFMDTDCGHCWTYSEQMSLIDDTFSSQLTIISVAVSLQIPNHDSSREEVVAFQDKASLQACNGGDSDCASRPGEAHNWAYFDDLIGSNMDPWGVQGTPFIVVIQPDGIVAWNQAQHTGVDVSQALFTLLPTPEE
ncbi:MAG: hypothetical protein QF807_00705 [Candidatus Thalassarchaeaceae archaeon]|jgi:hypothetical protein|nr:hypothetical protein [Candidatus Thalassarchaeaceae archaeon]MDP7042524.1 hypothetical protein [Candidatus Thalassarchaeaceae archaeon]